jgi:hypothetical protein
MTRISPTPGRSAVTEDVSRDWYYRMGERERGPMALAQLTDLVSSCGDLAREIVVRKHADGDWIPYETIDSVTARRLHPGSSAARKDIAAHKHAVQAASPPRSAKVGVAQRIRTNWPIVAGALVFCILNFIVWNVLDPFQRTERRYFEIVSAGAQKARDARAQGLDETARGRIAASVAKELKPIVADLKKSATPSDPIRQHLLWAAKDQLPKLFGARGKELDECDAIFQRHLYEAGSRLGIDVPEPPTSVVLP